MDRWDNKKYRKPGFIYSTSLLQILHVQTGNTILLRSPAAHRKNPLTQKTSAGVARLNLARWYNEVEGFGNNEFNKVLETFENHNTTIINYFERRLTNASAESFNAKIKAFRTQFRGVGDIKFFMFRLATLYS